MPASIVPAAHGAIPRYLLELDADLVRRVRSEGRCKLRLAELLDALFVRRGHHTLGFSSFEAYVVERCGRKGSWARETRAIARRIREHDLALIRRAIRAGSLSWSMAATIVFRATRENEEDLLAAALQSTVREMRVRLGGLAGDVPSEEDAAGELQVRRTARLSEEEILLLHLSRTLVEHLDGRRATDEALFTALCGEAETTLQSVEEKLGAASIQVRPIDAAQIGATVERMRQARLRRKTAKNAPVSSPPVVEDEAEAEDGDAPLPPDVRELDRQIVELCRELARRNLEVGGLLSALARSGAWRVFGYSSNEDYATERIGLSASSVAHLISLHHAAGRHPKLASALESGHIGQESALRVARVLGRWARDELVVAWVDRARRRTAKHLREEVEAVLSAVELDGSASRFPPTEAQLEAANELVRQVQSGELLRECLSGPQMSGAPPTEGPRLPRKFTLSAELYAHWRNVEAQLHAVAGAKISFITFACASLWDSWVPLLEAWQDKWKHIYLRDRNRCSSPVCNRRDVTPHHIHFQAHGGGHEDENVTSGCTWCHLEGIHAGRLRAEGPASSLRWTIGREPILVVEGREKRAL